MFGFFKYKATLKDVISAINAAIAPASLYARMSNKPLSNILFDDAYVLGFLQVYLAYVMKLSRKNPVDVDEQLRIFVDALDFYLPGMRKTITPILIEVNKKEHPYHLHLITGRQDAQRYVDLLQSGVFSQHATSIEVVEIPGLDQFTTYLKTHFVDNPAVRG